MITAHNVAGQIAAHFNTTEAGLFFLEEAYFGGLTNSCTVKFDGVWYDVFFTPAMVLSHVLKA